MDSRRCNLRTISGKAPSTLEGLTMGRRGESAPPGPTAFLGRRVRRLHLRLSTVSRFAGLLRSLDLV